MMKRFSVAAARTARAFAPHAPPHPPRRLAPRSWLACVRAQRRWHVVCAVAVLVAMTVACIQFEVASLLRFFALQAAFGAVRADACAPCGCLSPVDAWARAHCAEPLAPYAVWDAARAADAATPPSLLLRGMNVSACTRAERSLAVDADVDAALGVAGAGWRGEEEADSGGEVLRKKAAGGTANNPRLLIHLYARPDLSPDMPPWQLLTLASIVATQTSRPVQIVVWSPDARAPYPRALAGMLRESAAAAAATRAASAPLTSPLVTYRVFDGAVEAVGTPLEGSTLLRFRDSRGWSDSDVFRLVALHRYGGLYLDTDLWLFRDLGPLLRWEWASEFSADGKAGGGIVLLNNAAMHFFARSPAIHALATLAARATPPVLRSWVYGPLLLDRLYLGGAGGANVGAADVLGSAPAPSHAFLLMPWCFFHGMWSVGDDKDPAREVTDAHLVRGADWSRSTIMRDAWGLHMHGIPGKAAAAGEQPHPRSIVAVRGAAIRAAADARLVAGSWRK